MLWVRSDLPIKTLEDFKNTKTPLAAGSTGIGSASTAATLFLRHLGYPIKPIFGYRGTANVMAAMERKELDARVMSQQTMQGNYRRYIESGLVRPVLSMGEEPRLEPISGIATLKDLNLNAEQQRIADFLIGTWKLLRLFALPPGTPARPRGDASQGLCGHPQQPGPPGTRQAPEARHLSGLSGIRGEDHRRPLQGSRGASCEYKEIVTTK